MLSKELSRAIEWCERKKMALSTDKSSCLLNVRHPSYRPSSLPMPEKSAIKILGVQVNNVLDWSTHVNEISKKANQRMHALKQLRPLVSKDDLHMIYTALIRSILEYCCPAFVKLNHRLSHQLQKIDNRALRIIFHQSDLKTCGCGKDDIKKRREETIV